jgi:hypothetical protein
LVPANVLPVAEAARLYLPAKATFPLALMARLAVFGWRFQLASVVSQSATKAPSKSLETAATRFLAPRTASQAVGLLCEKNLRRFDDCLQQQNTPNRSCGPVLSD